MSADQMCPLCSHEALKPLREVDGVPYLRCDGCGSILAENAFLERTMAGEARNYDDDYWADELKAARERGYGSSLIRLAEVFLYARRPVRRFLDVSCGAGTLIDAAAELMPEIADSFWGIEPFPPPPAFRARHPNYRVGFLRDLEGRFDGGTCIEVIEHLPPPILRGMIAELAAVSEPDALWYFNSAQPGFVEQSDPGYLDPFRRGHIASYSIEGLRPLFAEAGFTLHVLPGRDWAFLAEYGKRRPDDGNALLNRIWQIHPDNRAILESARFGRLLLAAGMEGGRCYIEASRTAWAIGEMQSRTPEWRTLTPRERALEQQIAAMQASTSWRITRLMRAVMRRLRGGAPPAARQAPVPTAAAPVRPELVAHLNSQAAWLTWSQQHAAELTPDATQAIVTGAQRDGLTIPMFGDVPPAEVTLDGDPRETLSARGTNSRLRAVLLALSWHERAHDIWHCRPYMHEAMTAFALLLRSRYPRIIGSEYAPDSAAEKALWPVPAVDILRSPFPDGVFDFVLSNEVLEHIPDLAAGLRDTARIISPGGQFIGTCPFDVGAARTSIRARLTPSGIEHLHPPEYHGNPVDPEGGSLVFQIPGWDILDMCRDAGFAKAQMTFIGAAKHAITRGGLPGVFVLIATR